MSDRRKQPPKASDLHVFGGIYKFNPGDYSLPYFKKKAAVKAARRLHGPPTPMTWCGYTPNFKWAPLEHRDEAVLRTYSWAGWHHPVIELANDSEERSYSGGKP